MAERNDARSLSLTEQEALTRAVRDSVHDQIIDLLERRGLLAGEDLLTCPVCGDRTIVLDQPATFAFDRGTQICAACRAERDLIRIIHPDGDLGGEG